MAAPNDPAYDTTAKQFVDGNYLHNSHLNAALADWGYRVNPSTVTASGTLTVSPNTALLDVITLDSTAALTIALPSPPAANKHVWIKRKDKTGGAHTITFNGDGTSNTLITLDGPNGGECLQLLTTASSYSIVGMFDVGRATTDLPLLSSPLTTDYIEVTRVSGPTVTAYRMAISGLPSGGGGGGTVALSAALPAPIGAVVSSAGTSTLASRDDHQHQTQSWTGSTRPALPAAGSFGLNTTTARFEFYEGGAWGSYVRTGDTFTSSAAGVVAASGGGTTNFLRADGTWAVPSPSSNITTPRVITGVGAVAVASADRLVVINKSIGAATAVSLEASPIAGTVHRIKDGKGDASTNNITITPAAGTIDGAASAVIDYDRGVLTLEYTGTEWSIV